MIEKSQFDRLRSVEASLISDCMVRLGLEGWMDGVRPVQSGLRRAVGPARTLLSARAVGRAHGRRACTARSRRCVLATCS
jgi:hypothetical protein